MKKLFITCIAIIVLFFGTTVHAATIFSSQWEGTGVTDSSTWDAETGTGALTVATDQFLQGTHSLKFSRTGSTADYVGKSITATGTIGVRFALRINATVADFVQVLNLAGSGNDEAYIMVDGASGTLTLYNPVTVTQVGSGYTYSLNTWYQIEVKFVNGTSLAFKVWDAAGTTLLLTEQSTTTSVRANNCDDVLMGVEYIGTSGAVTLWLDSFIADNAAYPGPYVASAASAPEVNGVSSSIDINGVSNPINVDGAGS